MSWHMAFVPDSKASDLYLDKLKWLLPSSIFDLCAVCCPPLAPQASGILACFCCGINVIHVNMQPDELNLLEDGLQLWLIALRNAPSSQFALLDLFPNLASVMERSTGTSTCIF